ncbi:MAG: hypothetical protein ACTSQ4_10800 [Candidatus Heimdallarchaeaceae archaeon]
MTEESTSKLGFTIRITKKTQSASLPDIKEIIENYEKTEDETFWYVIFPEGNKDFEQLFEYVSTWKTTKLWIKGVEINLDYNSRMNFQKTIFCKYSQNCSGDCMHNLDLELYRHDWRSPFEENNVGERESIRGLKEWFNNNDELQKNDSWSGRHTLERELSLERMLSYGILTKESTDVRYTLERELSYGTLTKESTDQLNLDKKKLSDFIKKKLEFELKYCPKISIDKTLMHIEHIKDFIKINDSDEEIIEIRPREPDEDEIDYLRRLAGFTGDEEIIEIGPREPDEDEIRPREPDDEEIEYLKRLAGFIGDEIENRLRKVLSEFFEKKS